MAPTVCSEKKVRVSAIKEGRRRNNVGVAQANATTAATAAGAAAGATEHSAVLSYIAKGSLNSAGRPQRRRGGRLPSGGKSIALSSTLGGSGMEAEQVDSEQRMQVDDSYNKMSTQLECIHSSSSNSSSNNCSSSNSSNSNSNSSSIASSGSSSSSSSIQSNIKTVLQPTMANRNSSNCYESNKTATAKLCDHATSMDEDKEDVARAEDDNNGEDEDEDDDDEEEDQGDGDSGYEFALEPIKHHPQQPQYQTHNQGLLSIAIKTIKLVQRNKLLQKRLAQLQLETSEFIASVLANPENRHFREKITAKTDAANKVSNVLLRH